MMVSLVFTSVPYTAPVPFIIALQIGRAEAHKPVLPLTVGSSQSLTAFGSSMVPGASRSASTKAGPSNKRRNDTSLKGVKAVKAAKNGTASGRTKTSFGPVHIASSSADASMHVVEGVGLDQHSCSSSSSVSCSSCDSFSSSTCLTDSDSAGLGVGMDNGLTVRMADYAPLSAISPLGALFCGGGAAHPQIQAMRASAQAPVPYISGRMLAEFLLGPEVWEDVSYDTGSCGVSASLAAFYRSAAAVNNDANPAHPHSHPFFQSQPVGLIHPVVPVPQMLLPVHLAGPSTPTFPTVTAVSGPDKDVFAPRASVNVLPGPQHQPPLLGCECDSLSLQTTYLRHPAEGGVQQHQAHPEPPPRPQSPPGMCLIQNLFKH